jgi:hypothetical protein
VERKVENEERRIRKNNMVVKGLLQHKQGLC